MNKGSFIQKVNSFLHEEGGANAALDLIASYDASKANETVLLKSRIEKNESEYKQALLTKEIYNTTRNQILQAVQHLMDELPEESSENFQSSEFIPPESSSKGPTFFRKIFWLAVIPIALAAFWLIAKQYYSLKGIDTETNPKVQSNIALNSNTPNFATPFPNKYKKDTLFVLITRFEDYTNQNLSTDCVGFAIESRIRNLIDNFNVSIKPYYADNEFSPKDKFDAGKLRDKYHADLIIYGRLREMSQNCGEGEICFNAQPSNAIIKAVKGGEDLMKYGIQYQNNISPKKIESGEISVNGKRFDDWIISNYNAKVGKYNPEWYQINDNQDKKTLAKEYKTRGDIFCTNRAYQKAMQDYNKAITLNPVYADAYRVRGELKVSMKQSDEGLTDLKKAILHDPKDAISYFDISIILDDAGKADEALTFLSRAIECDSTFSSAYVNRGLIQKQKKQYSLAKKDYLKALEIDSNHILGLLNLGNLYKETNQNDSALFSYSKIIKINPTYAPVYYNIGGVLMDLHKYEGAISFYNITISLDSTHQYAFNNRGLCKYRLNKYKEAIEDFNKELEKYPTDSLAYMNRGKAKYFLGDCEGSIKDLDKSTFYNPKQISAYVFKGLVKSGCLGRHFEAIDDYNAALDINSKYERAYIGKASACSSLGNKNEALDNINAAIKINNKNAESYAKRGAIKFGMEKYQEALLDYDTSLGIDHKYADAWTGRAAINVKLEKYELALMNYDTALFFNPSDTNLLKGKRMLEDLVRSKNKLDNLIKKDQEGEGDHIYNFLVLFLTIVFGSWGIIDLLRHFKSRFKKKTK